jgi:small-conductance mechanosensitive channel
MKVLYRFLLLLPFICLFTSTGFNAIAQQADSLSKADTATPESFMVKIEKFRVASIKKSASEFEEEKTSMKQNEIMDAIKKQVQKAKVYLKTGIDTVEIQADFRKIESRYAIAGDGVFTNTGSAQTYRNLSTTYKILKELSNHAMTEKARLDFYKKKLDLFKFQIDSLSNDSSLFKFPSDSTALMNYLKGIVTISKEISPTDSLLKVATTNVHELQTQVDLDVNKLEIGMEQIEFYQQNLSRRTFKREFPNLGDDIGYTRPIGEILHLSAQKGQIILWFYAENNWGKILFCLIAIGIGTSFIRSLKKILTEGSNTNPNLEEELVLRYPLLSSIMVFTNLTQFIFTDPPYIFNVLFWLASAISLTYIFKNFVTKYWMNVWLLMLSLFILASLNNLILQASRTERIGMALLEALGVLIGVYILARGNKKELKERLIIVFIGVMTALELAALIFNFYGRYNIAKVLQISGFMNVIIGILFLWTVRLIDETLTLAYRAYIEPDKKLFYINFQRIGQKMPSFLYILLACGCIVLFGRNFYEFKMITSPFRTFFFTERTIGDYTFSISNLLAFFVIIGSSVLLSKIVSFFTSDKPRSHNNNHTNRKSGMGSWILLIRVSILAIGVLLAFAATGLPMERITLVLSAFGVGIGFGLQTLVNNLVSGLIIAVEKPVNVGDIVEINGQSGVVKSIGFRSSIISRWEGADIVIPNGDLLNAHLINWTLGGNKMRVDIVIRVAFGSDLDQIKAIITEVLNKPEEVLKYPASSVYFKEFNNSAIEIKISFWVRNYNDSTSVKSEVVHAINTTFKQHNIVMPFPQQDLHLYSDDSKETSTKLNEEK